MNTFVTEALGVQLAFMQKLPHNLLPFLVHQEILKYNCWTPVVCQIGNLSGNCGGIYEISMFEMASG